MKTQQLENNAILGEQQRLYHLLQETDSLSRQLELQIYSEENFDASIIKDVTKIKNLLFCNLIKEGFYFDYINTGNYTHDSLHMLIENVSYSCPLLEAQTILGDSFKDFCSEVPMVIKQAASISTNTSNDTTQKSSDVLELENKIEELANRFRELSNMTQTQIESNSNTVATPTNNTEIEEYIKQLEVKISSLSRKVEMESMANRQEFQMLSESHEQSMTDLTETLYETMAAKQADLVKQVKENTQMSVKLPQQTPEQSYIPEEVVTKFEKSKHRNSFIYDEITVDVMDPYGHPYDQFKIVVVPLSVAHNDNHVNIMVSVEGHNDKICAVSGKNSPIQITFRDTQILIRGLFADGDFKSLVIAAGETAALGYKLNLDTIYHRPTIKNFNYGHICFEKDNVTFHICPLQNDNNNKQVAVFICCLETNGNRYVFLSSEMSTTKIQTDLFNYSILTYWKDNFLYCEVLPC